MPRAFIRLITDANTHPLVIVGILRGDPGVPERLASAARHLCLPSPGDPGAVDRALARFARTHRSPSLLALGMSLGLPGGRWPCGGVIGAPDRSAVPADGAGHEITDNLSCACYSGGPGLVILGGPSAAAATLHGSIPGGGGEVVMRRLAEACLSRNVHLAIAVGDGTGAGHPPCGMILQGGIVELRSARAASQTTSSGG